MEASVERYRAEPGAAPDNLERIMSMLASSHRFAHAAMSLEAELAANPSRDIPDEFCQFFEDVDRTLEHLVAALRGEHPDESGLPDLREDHTQLLQHAGAMLGLLTTETDRIANSLNTLHEQIEDWVACLSYTFGSSKPLRRSRWTARLASASSANCFFFGIPPQLAIQLPRDIRQVTDARRTVADFDIRVRLLTGRNAIEPRLHVEFSLPFGAGVTPLVDIFLRRQPEFDARRIDLEVVAPDVDLAFFADEASAAHHVALRLQHQVYGDPIGVPESDRSLRSVTIGQRK